MVEKRELHVQNGMRMVLPDVINRPALTVLHEVLPHTVLGEDEFVPAVRKVNGLFEKFGLEYSSDDALILFDRYSASEAYIYQASVLDELKRANLDPQQLLYMGLITQVMRQIEHVARSKKYSSQVVQPIGYTDTNNERKVIPVGKHRIKSNENVAWNMLYARNGVDYVVSDEVDSEVVASIVDDTASKTSPLVGGEVESVFFSTKLTTSFYEQRMKSHIFIQLPSSPDKQYAKGIYALLHEQAHARQPDMFSLVMEIDAIRKVIEGLRAIYFRHPDEEKRFQLFKLLRGDELYLTDLLAKIKDSDFTADHNIGTDIIFTDLAFAS